MTVSDGQQAEVVASLASQRQSFSDRLAGAQTSLIETIAKLANVRGDTSAASAQLAHLAALQTSIGSASLADLQVMAGQIGAAIRQSQAVEREAQAQIVATNASEASAALLQAASAARGSVNNAMDVLRHTPLQFSSPRDEADYREREEETKRYIAQQQAKHTPEGDLNASGAAVGQMADAKAHGAKGPEFDKQCEELVANTERLREQIRQSGGSTKEFDDRLRESIRHTLKSKGLSDEEIEAQFAAHHNDPLAAAKAYLSGPTELQKIANDVKLSDRSAALAQSPSVEQAPAATPPGPLADAVAALRAAGVSMPTQTADAQPEHGVTAQGVSTPAQTRLA